MSLKIKRGGLKMSMFCFQCQENRHEQRLHSSWRVRKNQSVSRLQDAMLFAAKGLALVERATRKSDALRVETGRLLVDVLFTTITNVNFDDESYIALIDKVVAATQYAYRRKTQMPNCPTMLRFIGNHRDPNTTSTLVTILGVLTTEKRRRPFATRVLVYGVKGVAAYAHHAMVLGFENIGIYDFIGKALDSTTGI
jgi:hydroxylamine reductase